MSAPLSAKAARRRLLRERGLGTFAEVAARMGFTPRELGRRLAQGRARYPAECQAFADLCGGPGAARAASSGLAPRRVPAPVDAERWLRSPRRDSSLWSKLVGLAILARHRDRERKRISSDRVA